MKISFKKIRRYLVPPVFANLHGLLKATRPLAKRRCPICDYYGYFDFFGRPPRLDARCPNCRSLERHRLFWLWFQGDATKLREPILHFAPEAILERKFRRIFKDYRTADLYKKSDLRLNIEKIDLNDSSAKTVICNHVLEHVNDEQALAEIRRILTDDGIFICSVPIIEGWEHTYENKNAATDFGRELHFGQHDHVRFYGRDFRDRLRTGGFSNIIEVTAEGEDVVTYGLWRGEKFFICQKG